MQSLVEPYLLHGNFAFYSAIKLFYTVTWNFKQQYEEENSKDYCLWNHIFWEFIENPQK